MAGDLTPVVRLPYVIYDVSSYHGDFSPRHVLVDKPLDQKSRWLSDGSKPPQYVVLKLAKPAVVHKILFGKYEKSHPCNIRKLQVYGGLDADHTHILFEGGLNNDSIAEMLDLQYLVDGRPFPCQYIKVVPLQSWGENFNFSIWHLQLWGMSEETQVDSAMSNLRQFREKEAVRLCLKHLRQYDYSQAFELLQKKSKILLEHPLLTELHCKLVNEGNFEEAENILCRAMEEGYFNSHVSQQAVRSEWTFIPYKMDPESNQLARPLDMRGGHQMCIDSNTGQLYLYGGWGGSKELGDFWKFNTRNNHWTCLSQDTSREGGPGPKSCHCMCYNSRDKVLYILGAYVESGGDIHDPTHNKFYCYSIDDKKWKLLSSDTFKDGGPRLIHHHQMCFDSTSGLLYVLGGNIHSTDLCSGLYAYNAIDHHWLCLVPDQTHGPIQPPFLPRSGHVMLFHSKLHKLFVLGGQRQQKILSDMLTYDLRSGETHILTNGSDQKIPMAGFTLRAAIDESEGQIYALTGLCEDKDAKGCNILWIYDIQSEKWSKVLRDDKVPLCDCPVPRCANSFVYDRLQHVFYMFGGNPGSDVQTKSNSSMRLDDLWKLRLASQSKENLLREFQFSLRKQRYIELSWTAPVDAVTYLKTSVAPLVNHSNPEESQQYRELTGALFNCDHASSLLLSPQRMRSELYDKLAACFPDNMSQPKDNLIDLIKLS